MKSLWNKLLPLFAIVALLHYLFDFRSLDLSVPLGYDGDALLTLATIKTMVESGWIFYNNHLGAPYGMNFLDFPGSDNFFLIILKIISYFSQDPPFILNVFYILGFLLIYFSTFWACRKFEINFYLSIALAIVFTIAPYHFLRNVKHLFLATYFIVPLITVVIVDIGFGVGNAIDRSEPLQKINWKYLLILCIAGMCGVYYAFFSLIFIFVAGILGWITIRKNFILKNTLLACTTIIVVVLLSLLPNIIYRIHEGVNFTVAQRGFFESEIYGLRITQLLLPIWGHRNEFLANLNHRYQDHLLITEATSSALGIIASVGFISLIAISIFGFNIKKHHSLMVLAKLNLVAILFTTIGGFGILFALLVTPQFRGLNRISIFVAFFSLVAFGIFLQQTINYLSRKKKLLSFMYPLIGLFLVVFSIYDQIPLGAIGKSEAAIKNYYEEKRFIDKIESSLPQNSMVYQYPYVQFPETAPLYKEGYYEFLKPYLHSRNLKWSYGAIKGRDSDLLHIAIGSLSSSQQALAIFKTGFSGVLINKLACKDACIDFESQIKNISYQESIINKESSNVFYRIDVNKMSDSMDLVGYMMGPGFYPTEKSSEGGSWNWATGKGKISIYNFSNTERIGLLKSKIVVLQSEQLLISNAQGFRKRIQFVRGEEMNVSIELQLQPGINDFEFDTSAPPIEIKPDPRKFGFRLSSTQVNIK